MNYKEEVLKVYPDARAEQDNRGFWHIVNNCIPISAFAHEEDYAWEHAIVTIHVPAPTHTTITVTGCGDCPFHSFYGQHEWNHCSQTGNTESNPDYPLFSTCPLKTSPITIMLKQ